MAAGDVVTAIQPQFLHPCRLDDGMYATIYPPEVPMIVATEQTIAEVALAAERAAEALYNPDCASLRTTITTLSGLLVDAMDRFASQCGTASHRQGSGPTVITPDCLAGFITGTATRPGVCLHQSGPVAFVEAWAFHPTLAASGWRVAVVRPIHQQEAQRVRLAWDALQLGLKTLASGLKHGGGPGLAGEPVVGSVNLIDPDQPITWAQDGGCQVPFTFPDGSQVVMQIPPYQARQAG